MNSVKVWDPFVRVFHWVLVLAIISQLVTAELDKTVHFYTGYFITLWLILRIVWGFIGSKYARFSDFIYPPSDIFGYLKGLIHRKPKQYLGHNPAGGAMVIVLLVVLCLTAFAGLKTLGAHGKGPLANSEHGFAVRAYADGSDAGTEQRGNSGNDHDRPGIDTEKAHFWKEVHETLVGLLIFLNSLSLMPTL